MLIIMPSGTTHARATVALAAVAGYMAYSLGHPTPEVLALSGGALAGVVLTPDLDVDVGCISNRIIRRSGGKVPGKLWALYWRPYGKLMPHRSNLSHLPVVSTAIRLLYLALLPALLYWLATAAGFAAGQAITAPVLPAWGWWAFGGLVLADTLHYLMDHL
jgi:uncharacterized metal-binding protein